MRRFIEEVHVVVKVEEELGLREAEVEEIDKLLEQTWLKEVNPLKYLANFFRTFSGR